MVCRKARTFEVETMNSACSPCRKASNFFLTKAIFETISSLLLWDLIMVVAISLLTQSRRSWFRVRHTWAVGALCVRVGGRCFIGGVVSRFLRSSSFFGDECDQFHQQRDSSHKVLSLAAILMSPKGQDGNLSVLGSSVDLFATSETKLSWEDFFFSLKFDRFQDSSP